MSAEKPYKGKISHWRRIVIGAPNDHEDVAHLGYYISGRFIAHPSFGTAYGHTSMVVSKRGRWIETYNSRYELVGEERK